MPTYAYACTTCEHRFEVHQAFSDTSLTDCPECAGRLRKLFNTVGIVFKGSGFYRTDSRAGGAGERGDAAKDAGTGSSDGSASGAGAGKDSGGKDSGGKDSGGKDSGGKDSGGKEAARSGSAASNGAGGTKAAKRAGAAGSSTGAKTPAA